MASHPQLDAEPDERFQEVASDYLDALDCGRSNEQIRLLLEHPDLAADLARFVADQTLIAGLAAPLRYLVQESIRTSSNAPDLPSQPSFPRTFGDYELVRELGRGGMGVVYEGRQRGLNRSVALKMIRAGSFASEEDTRRFQNEARAAAALDHPGILPIYEIGELEGQLYFTMKQVDGPNLAERLRHYCDDLSLAARLVAAIARAVHHAHEHKILHRDLKPSNILLDPAGQPHVTDFGLAKHLSSDEHLTHSGAIVGTPTYMAPEQFIAKRGSVTAAADVYGLGAILYTLLTGQPPFVGASSLDTMRQVAEREPKQPSSLNSKVDRDIQSISLKCLEKLPGNRYSSAKALSEDLERWLAGEPILARPIGRTAQVWRWCLRNPVIATLTAAAGLLLVLLVAGLSLGLVLVSAKEKDAQNLRQDAENQKTIALDQAAALRRRVYVADMAGANEAWQVGDVDTALAILRGQVPNVGQEDLRGFEWHYLFRLATHIPRVVATLEGHVGDVYSVCYSSDGLLIATAGKDGTARVWDVKDYRQIAKYPHAGEVNCVAFTSNSETLACCTDEGLIYLWDIASSKERKLPGHKGEVAFVQFAPDGRTLASCGRDGTVRLWDVATGTGTILGKDQHPFEALTISPDGRLIAAVRGGDNKQGVVRVWDIATRKAQTGQSPRQDSGFFAVAFSSDSKRLATGSGLGSLKTWNPENLVTSRDMRCSNYAALDALSFAHNSPWLFAGRRDGTCELWDTRSERQLARFQTNCGRLWRISAASNGQYLATAGRTGLVRIWDVEGFGEYAVLTQRDSDTHSLAFTPNSKQLAVGCLGGQVRVLDLSSRRQYSSLEPEKPVGPSPSITILPDGKTLALGYGNGFFGLWDFTSPRHPPATIPIGPGSVCSAYFPDGKAIAIASGKTFVLRDLKAGECLLREELPWVCNYLASTGSDGLVAVGEGHIRFWDRQERKWSPKAIEDPVWITCMATTADGRIMALGHQTGTIEIRATENGDLLSTLAGHRTVVTSVAFTPDGKTLASASEDGTLQLWHVPTAQKLFTLAKINGLRQIAFSADGRFLAAAVSVGHEPAEVLLWDAFNKPEAAMLALEKKNR